MKAPGPEDSGWFTVVGRGRTLVESRTDDDTAHRAVTAVQRCPSGSRSARSAGTPWANSGLRQSPLARVTRSISHFRAIKLRPPPMAGVGVRSLPAIGRLPVGTPAG